MNKLKLITLVLLLNTNLLLSQKLIITGSVRNFHLQKISTIILKANESGFKQSIYSLRAPNLKPLKINANKPLETQLNVDETSFAQKSVLVSNFTQTVLKYKKKYPNKEIILVCLSKFDEKIPLPFGCYQLEYVDYLNQIENHKNSIVLLAPTPSHIEIELEKPDTNEDLEKSIIDLKGTITSDVGIKSIRYQFGSKGWQTLDVDLIPMQNGISTFWVQNQWPFKGNVKEYITIQVIDLEGNSIIAKFGPFKLIETEITPNNCFFKYYEKNIHDVALLRNFKSSNVYWFPIYSEIDPSNLSFVLIDKLGREHIAIRLIEDNNFVRNITNEYCIGIPGGELNIGDANCTLIFQGQCLLRHNSNKTQSSPIDIKLNNFKPGYVAPLAECAK
jgi:hypothetical protein